MTDEARTQNVQQTAKRWLLKSLAGSLVMALILLATAGTLRWPMAWLWIVVLMGVSISTYLFVDAELIAERAINKRSSQGWDNVILPVYGLLAMFAVPVIAGFDFRYGWSPELPYWLMGLALLADIAGWALHIWSMRVNAFFAIVVRLQEERGQTVISGGPYQWMRHPGYVGGLAFTLASPIVLGSLWALIPGIVAAGLLVLRTALEDRMLQRELAGYSEYATKIRYRLVPGIW